MKIQARQTQNLTQGLQQGLTMTPQLVQSIKLLQMSSIELLRHIEEQIEKNPLLELSDGDSRAERGEGVRDDNRDAVPRSASDATATDELDTSQAALEAKLDTSFENEFDADRSGGETSGHSPAPGTLSQGMTGASGPDFSRSGDGDTSFEEFVADRQNLRDYLGEQLAMTRADPAVRIAAGEIIDCLDEDGYFRGKLSEIAVERQVSPQEVETALAIVQGFDPVGVGARDLAECLKLQLIENNRFDPAIGCLLDNLELLARRDFESLVEICGVSHDEVMDMVDEIRALDPRPAKQFDTSPTQAVIADVYVRDKPDGSFEIELNPDAMPKVLVNQSYQAVISASGNSEDDRFVTDCLNDANWLVRSLEQRAQTILKVMTEIVRQQDGFFVHGISHLRPMSLKMVADAIKMHESTVSRVTNNKYVLTNRGMFELKFFFTAALGATDGADSHSAEAVRQKIREMISAELPEKVLSDDALVDMLNAQGVDIARRTVAKYREAMNIASSVQRRREKKAKAARRGRSGN